MPWIVRTTDFKTSELPEVATPCSKNQLLISSLQKLGLFWGLALVSVFIPVLHFFLVPTFLIVGIFAFFSQMKNTHFISQATFICPHCAEKATIQKFFFQADKRFQCKLCSQQLVISTRA